jgi:hypothetical protein
VLLYIDIMCTTSNQLDRLECCLIFAQVPGDGGNVGEPVPLQLLPGLLPIFSFLLKILATCSVVTVDELDTAQFAVSFDE